MNKYRVVCGACIILCKTFKQAIAEAIKLNRKTVYGLIDYYDKKTKCWKPVKITKQKMKCGTIVLHCTSVPKDATVGNLLCESKV